MKPLLRALVDFTPTIKALLLAASAVCGPACPHQRLDSRHETEVGSEVTLGPDRQMSRLIQLTTALSTLPTQQQARRTSSRGTRQSPQTRPRARTRTA